MEYGTKIHEELEYSSFVNSSNEYINKLLSLVDNNFINVYKEYEFIVENEKERSVGIIDLMLEYEDSISIIDYKLKNVDDKEYVKQLKGYKKYIEGITDKKINTYLYSVIDGDLKEVK
jgi:ATP-dependent exoDNAse (exonuclease V) beta subunit